MKAYPHFPRRKTVDLNTLWDFKFIENNLKDITLSEIAYDDRIPVPSAFDALPAYAGKRGLGIYRCRVEISVDKKSALKIGGAGMICDVFVDGKHLAHHIGTYTPFEVIIPAAKKLQREIVVVTDNRYNFEKCPLQENFFDFYNYGGIIRQVWLEELPDNPITQAYVLIDDYETGQIRVRVKSSGSLDTLFYSIDGGELQPAEFNDDGDLIATVPEPTPWSHEEPNLHTLTVDSGNDAITVRFGLREIATEDGQILLNREPVKLLGYCRHESHPSYGPALPDMQLVYDLQLLKELGCNFIRGSHYQQDPRFLDMCDEQGFLFFSESMGWGQQERHFTDENFIQAQLTQTEAMIRSDFNHPSIIMWGFLNEGHSTGEFARNCYTRLVELIRFLDPSRPVTYATNQRDKDIFLDMVDIISYNIYPGWYSNDRDSENIIGEVIPAIENYMADLKERGLDDKPFIISEIGAGAIYGWHDPLNGVWTEEYQSELLQLVCRRVVSDDRIAGVSLWQFCDGRTYQGGGALARPRAFNNKGTVDEYRRPKAAFKEVKRIFNDYKDAK